ncbi:MAG: hypothetical protein ACRDTE_29415 [Pseudonocardiaceae bacterium]
MEVHSERESYRRVIELRTPEEQAASVIVMRRTSSVWVTFDGAIKTTVIMNDPQAGQFIDAVAAARTPR